MSLGHVRAGLGLCYSSALKCRDEELPEGRGKGIDMASKEAIYSDSGEFAGFHDLPGDHGCVTECQRLGVACAQGITN